MSDFLQSVSAQLAELEEAKRVQENRASLRRAEFNRPANADAAGAWCDHATDENEDSRQAGC